MTPEEQARTKIDEMLTRAGWVVIAGSVSISLEAFQLAPFSQEGGLARAHALFGEALGPILEELNLALAA